MNMQQGYGEVEGRPVGEMTRRSFMRRMLGVGLGILTLEFLGGSLLFLWPNVRSGLGGQLSVGTADDILAIEPQWAAGLPLIFQQKIFFINVPAIKQLVDGETPDIPDPGTEVSLDIEPVDRSVLALYRKCPHLGCQIPQLCDASKWFECLCHGSKYTAIGEKRAGPAPRGMDRFDVVVQDGAYAIDTSVKIDGPPIGTDTFDSRNSDSIPHCAG